MQLPQPCFKAESRFQANAINRNPEAESLEVCKRDISLMK